MIKSTIFVGTKCICNQETLMNKSYNSIIGRNLRLFREKLGLTQDSMETFLGVDRTTLSLYENGKSHIPTDVISKAANIFGVEDIDLYEENPEGVLAFAFRAESLSPEDLNHIADFKKIVLNYLKMKKALPYESSDC